jgi:hypothetical protein
MGVGSQIVGVSHYMALNTIGIEGPKGWLRCSDPPRDGRTFL